MIASAIWLVSIRFKALDHLEAKQQRYELLKLAHSAGFLLRPVWKPLHQLPMYQLCPKGSLAVAEDQAQRLVNLPSSPQLLKGNAIYQ